jgi:2-polyprenyl-6-methoxyphenol hydroxylase-like FAD-dependent oxidoreductase
VTLGGCHGDHPPTDDEGFAAFAASLPSDDLSELITTEEPIGEILPHRLASSQWRRYDKVKRHPVGFLALGDAICSFNPIYGQGMSSAAQQAIALGACLDASGLRSAGLAPAFYKAAKKVIANPWAIAAGGDFVFPETTGPKPPGTDVINRYVGRVVVAAQHDPKVAHEAADAPPRAPGEPARPDRHHTP